VVVTLRYTQHTHTDTQDTKKETCRQLIGRKNRRSWVGSLLPNAQLAENKFLVFSFFNLS
jgi:hypothetical protein